MTTTQLVLLGVAVLAVAVLVLAVGICHARTVLDEAELRTGVRRCGMSGDRAGVASATDGVSAGVHHQPE
ncbi:hypothetical protein [Ornithinimicrobium flavum]|uniref:hypothetical protein n=1 Tax=Ornithinimicrobium flavum TaxID=1288636 RepID=UPI00106F9400|nr:hypothetical protein [Ornithinimicrobium flavum]